MRGVIDLVRAGGCIVDFKTSARTPDKELACLLHETQLDPACSEPPVAPTRSLNHA